MQAHVVALGRLPFLNATGDSTSESKHLSLSGRTCMKKAGHYAATAMYVNFIGDKINNLNAARLITLQAKG